MYPTYSLIYSIPFLLISLFLVFLIFYEYQNNCNRRIVRFYCIILFIIFFGLRGFVSYDWIGYYPAFEAVDSLQDFSSNSFILLTGDGRERDLIEPGYILYMSILKTIWNNWSFFVFISAVLNIYVFDKLFQRYSLNYAFSFLVFFSLHNVLEFDLMRNIKALIIFVLSFDAIYRRQWGRFIIWSVIGFSFHRTFLMFIPFYFLGLKDFGKKTWWNIFVIINLVYILQIPVATTLVELASKFVGGAFAEKIGYYLQSEIYSAARGFTLGYIVRVIVFFLIIRKYDEIILHKKEYVLILNIYLAYIIVSIGMTDFSVFADRIEYLFGFALWILYPVLSDLYMGWKRQLYLAFILSFCLMRVTLQTSNAMCDYESVLTGAADYDTRLRTHKSIAEEIIHEK